jgi:hypothetical protein
MRSTLVERTNLSSLIQSGELAGLTLHSVVYLGLGLLTFALGYRRVRAKGTLAHY